MTDKIWLGIAKAVAQVSTIQITGFDAATEYTLTVNGLDVTVQGDTDENTTASNLAAAWELETGAYFAGIAATSSTDTVTLTGGAGLPFTVTSSVSGGSGTIGAVSATTAATGPAHFDNADNWSPNGVPVANDNLIFENGSQPLLFALDQNTLSLDDHHQLATFTGFIGLSPNGFTTDLAGTVDTSVAEYRDQYLKAQFDNITIGASAGPSQSTIGEGSTRTRIHNSKAGASTCTVIQTPAAAETNGGVCFEYLADNAGADVDVQNARGGVGLAIHGGETGTYGDVLISDFTEQSRVFIGSGATYTNFRQYGGNNQIDAAADLTAVECEGGILTTLGQWEAGAVTVEAGTLYLNNRDGSNVAATTITQNGGIVDTTTSRQARSATTYNHNGGELLADKAVFTTGTYNRPAGPRRLAVAAV